MSSSEPGRVALISGGAVRVGREISLALARCGYNIALHYCSSAPAAAALLDQLSGLGVTGTALHADLTRPGAAGKLVSAALRALGRLDLLVNSAALLVPDDGGQDELQKMVELNRDAPWALLEAAAAHLARSADGSVVNIADVAALVPFPDHRVYSSTKEALVARTRRAALQMAPRGIRVNAVCPGTVLPASHYSSEQIQRLRAAVPLGRLGSPEDVTQAVCFLAGASHVTGQVIVVDGGQSLATLLDALPDQSST